MENNLRNLDYEEQNELPPGFRFHPTDDELITYYLYQKALDASFVSQAIGDVDLNKIEPWDLPLRAKIGEKEWYFFCVRDRKYPTGLRTNRATEMGYWKATGKDKEIFKGKTLVGMKKTLVFYKGRAPKGVKTNWIMHEFRIEGKLATDNLHMSTKGEWVISKVFEKICGGDKTHVSGGFSINHNIHEDDFNSSNLPQLKDISSFNRETISDVTQQQNPIHEDFNEGFSRSVEFMPLMKDNPLWFPNTQMVPNVEYLEYNDPLILKLLIDNDYYINMRQNPKMEVETDQDNAMNLNGAVDINGLWSYMRL